MVTIQSPQNRIVDVTVDNSSIITWEPENGQVAYEFQYKFRKDSFWRTAGKVNSTTQRTYDLYTLYSLLGVDFYDIVYRIVIYYDRDNTLGHENGYETSEAYTVTFKMGASGNLKVYDGEDIVIYPTYKSIHGDIDRVNINTSPNGEETDVEFIPLVDDTSVLAGDTKVQTNKGTFHFASNTPEFYYTGFGNYGEFNQYKYEYQNIYDYAYGSIYNYAPRYTYGPVYSSYPNYSTGTTGYGAWDGSYSFYVVSFWGSPAYSTVGFERPRNYAVEYTGFGAYATTYKIGKNLYGIKVVPYTYYVVYIVNYTEMVFYTVTYYPNSYSYVVTYPNYYYVVTGYYYYISSYSSYVTGYFNYISGYTSYWVEDKSYAYIHHVNDVSYSYKYYYGE